MAKFRVKLIFEEILGTDSPPGNQGSTQFYRDSNGQPAIAVPQIMGCLNEAAERLNLRVPVAVRVLSNEKRIAISGKLEVESRKRRFRGRDGTQRVRFVRSEIIRNALVQFEVETDDPDNLPALFEYAGKFIGMGQWRKAGHGRFTAEVTRID